MVLLEPNEARFHAIEERLTRIEERMATRLDIATLQADLAEIKGRLGNVATPWLLIGLILPIYGLVIFGFAGVFYFLLSYARPG